MLSDQIFFFLRDFIFKKTLFEKLQYSKQDFLTIEFPLSHVLLRLFREMMGTKVLEHGARMRVPIFAPQRDLAIVFFRWWGGLLHPPEMKMKKMKMKKMKMKKNENEKEKDENEKNENENEKKNEKCLFSNTQEFLHTIFITSFK